MEISSLNCSMKDNMEACRADSETILIPGKVLYMFFLFPIFVISVCGNSIVCTIVYQKPAMRSAINLLLATLALSHILLTVICLPFAITTLLLDSWVFGAVVCRLTVALHTLFVSQASFVLLTISIDRYLIIVHKKDRLTPLKAKTLIGIMWVASVCISFPPTVGWGLYVHYDGWMQCILKEHRNAWDMLYASLAYSFVFYIPILGMSYSYLCILHKVRLNMRRIANYPAPVSMTEASKLGLYITPYNKPNVDMSFKTKAFKTILILFVVFVICWTPYALAMMIWNCQWLLKQRYTAGSGLLIIGYMNTAINPIIYFWQINKFKEACQEVFPKLVKWVPGLKVRTRRRVNPSTVYEVPEVSSVQPSVES